MILPQIPLLFASFIPQNFNFWAGTRGMASPARTPAAPAAKHRANAPSSHARLLPLAIDEHPTDVTSGEYGQFPDEVLDVLPDKVSGYAQDLIVRYILRDTVGRKRRTGSPAPAISRPLTNAQLARAARLTGKTAAKTAADIMRDLVERGLVARYTADGELAPVTKAEASGLELADKGGRPRGNGGVAQYCYRALWKNWRFCPDHTPKKLAADVEVDESKGTAETETEVVTSLSAPRALKPGGKFKGKIEPDTREYEVRSKDVEGVGASVAKEGTRLLIVLSKTEVATSLSAKPRTENKRVTISELREKFTPTWRDRFRGEPLEDSLLKRVLDALGRRPLEQLMSRVASEFPKMAKAHRLQTGSIVALARQCNTPDAAREWDAIAVESRAIDERATNEQQREAKQRARLIAEHQAILNDPNATAEDKRWARELLESLS